MLRAVRRRAAEVGWWEAVDALRPSTQAIWRLADIDTRRRFLRHLRPWWDVHRHRMAPAIADRIEAMRSSGRLRVFAARIGQTAARPAGVDVTWRPRGGLALERLRVARIVNCTGAGAATSEARDPLIRALVDQGAARLDTLGLGLEVDGECRLIGRGGEADPRLYAIGPITRGSFWETNAVPDIRNQVAAVAARIGAQLARTPHETLSA